MPPLLGDFCFAKGASFAAPRQSTMFRQRSAASLRDRESFSGPCPFGDAGMVALHHVSGTPQLIQLSVLTAAGGNGEH